MKRLGEIGEYLKKTFARNLAKEAELSADTWEEGHEIDAVRTDDYDSFFRTQDGVRTAQITLAFPEPARVSHVVLKENIRMSQRIEGFEITAVSENGEEQEVYRGTVVGYQKIARFPEIAAKRLQIRITDSRVFPTLSFIGVY